MSINIRIQTINVNVNTLLEAGLWLWYKMLRLPLMSGSEDYRIADASNQGNTAKPYSGQAYDFRAGAWIDVGDVEKEVNTICFWINPDTTTEPILDLDGGTHTIEINAGTLTANGFSSPTYYVNGVETQTVAASSWQFIAIVTDTAIDVNDLEIGRIATDYLEGYMCSLRMFSTALNAATISRLYNNPELVIPRRSNTTTLAAYWPLMEGNTAAPIFEHVNSKHGTGTSLSATGAQPGIIPQLGIYPHNYVSYFNGNPYIEVADDATLDITGDITIALWMHTTNINQSAGLLTKNPHGDAYSLYLVSGELRYRGSNTSYVSYSGLESNTLYHIAVVHSGTSVTLYVDGTSVATGSTAAPTATGDSLQIGGRGSANQFTGIIYEAAIWSSALTADNISTLADDNNQLQPRADSVGSPVAYWINRGGATWYDEIGSLNGSIQGVGRYIYLPQGRTQGKDILGFRVNNDVQSAMLLNGTEYALTDDSDTIDITGNFTFMCWVYLHEIGSAQTILNRSGSYVVKVNTSNQIVFEIVTSSAADSQTTTGTISRGAWQHIAITYNATTGSSNIYIDNASPETDTLTTGIDSTSNDLFIGSTHLNTNKLNGFLDEVKLYAKELSASEISTEYNNTLR